jgi:type I restriction enzyme M protein
VWVLSNRKVTERRNLVQLIDATSFWTQMRKSLGDKRREIPPDKADRILSLLRGFKEGEYVKIYPTTHFGFRKITVERPLRQNFQASPERIARLEQESAFKNLAVSKKKGAKEKAKEEEEGRKQQSAILRVLGTLPAKLFKDRVAFQSALDDSIKSAGLKISAPVRKAILSALSERDESAEICRDSDGNPEPDPELRDTENVPLAETIDAYFEREVKPYVPDASVNMAIRDEKDSEIGKVGYEINFNRYFYKYTPPRPLEQIEADIKAVEKDVLEMLREVAC